MILARQFFTLLIFFAALNSVRAQVWQPVQYANGTSPLARHENGFVEVNGKFYLIGGRGIKNVNIFDPATRIWTAGAAPPIELHHFQPVVYQNRIYAICALTGAYPAETPVDRIYIYDPALNTWSQGATIPAARRRGSSGLVLFNNKFYVMSGIQVGHQSGWVAWTDEYDPVTGIWTVLPDAPQARDHFHAGLINGKVYCVGGRRTSQPNFAANTIANVDVFDIATRTWSIPTQIPTPRGAPAVAVVNNELVVGGGEVDYSNSALSIVQSYNPVTNTWTTRPDLNVGRHATQFIYYSGTLYIAAGSTTQGGSGENNTMASAPYGNPPTQTLTNVIRINAGGPAQNFGGEAWVADQNFTGGSVYSAPNAIANTTQDPIYQTERFGNFSYAIPVGQAGTYAVDLHFAEIYFGAVGQRTFNINVENGQFVRNNFDIVQAAGSNNSAYVLRADNLNITDGTINITFTTVVNNAKVSGISVGRYSSPPANTPPVVIQAPAPQIVPNTQSTVVLNLANIFNDNGGVNNLIFSVPNNTNAALISNTQISGTQLTFTLSGTTGAGTITLRATDASNASVETTFQLTVTLPANTPPVVIQAPAPQSVPNTQATVVLNLANIFNDNGGVNNLNFAVTNNTNAALISNTQISGTQLTFTLSGTTGTGTITLRATDASNASVETTFQLTVTPPGNTPPVIIKPVEDKFLLSSDGSFIVQMTEVFADDGGIGNLTFSVTGNTNPALISNTQVSGTQITFTLSGLAGDGDITLRATDASNAFVQDVFHLGVSQGTNQPIASITRINAGGAAQNFNGENWEADRYFTGGSVYSTTAAINNTTRDPIYQTERYGNFSYAIPVPHSGVYGVDLYLAEIYFNTAGSRVFNINIENGQYVRSNLDLIQTIGAINTATVIRVENLNVTDGTLNITFTTVKDNAKISGIEVLEFANPNPNTAPVVVQAPAPRSVPGNQGPVVLQLGQIFGDDGGVNSLQFSITNNTNPALLSNTAFGAQSVTFTLSGTTGSGTITLRATDTNGLFVETPFQLTVTAPVPTGPVVIQAPAAQSVPNTQPTVVLNLAQIFNDDGGVSNLTFAVTNNTNPALLSNTQIVGTQITFTLSGTTGSGTITLRATDATSAFVQTNFQLTVTSGVQTLTNVIRINAGGPAQNFSGQAWVADQYFTGGTVYNTTTPIANTTQDPIYQSERFGTFSYAIPVGQAGTYAVDLHFAEIYFGQAGQRVFNINVENGQFVRNNFDIMQTYGANNAAFVLRADNLNITDGTINISFITVINNAKISGIAVGRYSSGSSARMAPSESESIVAEPEADKKHEQTANYQVYPNPTQNDEFYVKLDVAQRERWSFALVDFAGRQIDLGSFELEQGVQELTFDIRRYGLSSGIYYLSMQNGQTKKNVKLAIK